MSLLAASLLMSGLKKRLRRLHAGSPSTLGAGACQLIVGNRAIVRGAPEAVLERCREIGDVEQAVSHMVERGLRVITIAVRDLDGIEVPDNTRCSRG